MWLAHVNNKARSWSHSWADHQRLLSNSGQSMNSLTNEVVSAWIREAAGETAGNQRHNKRYPFFRPVTITIGESQATKHLAFARDIATKGIGLLHNLPLPTDRLLLSIPKAPIPTAEDHRIDVNIDITWCKPCAEGWYLSGGRFVGLAAKQLTSLILEVVSSELKRRVRQRYPFFRPMTLGVGDTHETRLPVFSRDISAGGIGLLHKLPVEPQRAKLTIQRPEADPLEIYTDIAWCQPCGEDWHLSGGRFMEKTLQLDELPDLHL